MGPSPGISRPTSHHQQLRERQGTGFSLEPLKENNSVDTLIWISGLLVHNEFLLFWATIASLGNEYNHLFLSLSTSALVRWCCGGLCLIIKLSCLWGPLNLLSSPSPRALPKSGFSVSDTPHLHPSNLWCWFHMFTALFWHLWYHPVLYLPSPRQSMHVCLKQL